MLQRIVPVELRTQKRLRRLATRAYFYALVVLAAVVAWNATAGAHRRGGESAAAAESPGDGADLLSETPPPRNGAQALACDTSSQHLQMLGPLREASGLTLSRRTPGVLWSMNDSDDPVVVPLSTDGQPLGRVSITGA